MIQRTITLNAAECRAHMILLSTSLARTFSYMCSEKNLAMDHSQDENGQMTLNAPELGITIIANTEWAEVFTKEGFRIHWSNTGAFEMTGAALGKRSYLVTHILAAVIAEVF